MADPIVSIGIPVFNGANYLRLCLETLLAQDFIDFEIVVSDNASTDDTEAICREMAQKDSRIRYFRNETNIGAAGNYNRVFEEARGRYFKWAAHDDECHPSMIRRCVEVLEASAESVVMVYPLAELIDDAGVVISAPLDRIALQDSRPYRRLGHVLWSLNMCDPIFGVYKTKYLRKTQLIGPFIGADYVVLGELAMMGEIVELPEVLFRLREHKKRSMQANGNTRERVAWYNPAAARKLFVLPDWEQMVVEMFKSALHARLPFFEKLRCCVTVPAVHYWRRFKDAGGLLKRRIKKRLKIGSVSQPIAELRTND